MTGAATARPLQGVRIIELVGIGPCPYAGQLLADLGAEVIAVDKPQPGVRGLHDRGKRSVTLDLRADGAAEAVLRLCEGADALIEGYRPGVAERLGLGPDAVRARKASLVYGRMTGWGQTGPWAKKAGHDINYIGLTGALHAMGEAGAPPPPPLNLVGDYGGGSLFLVAGLLAAMLRAKTTGEGSVVDAAILDGTASLMGIVHTLKATGMWTEERQANLLDGGAPFYRCYACADGGFMAVGAIEPQFHAEMLRILKIDSEAHGAQLDRAAWPRQHAALAARFAEKPRDAWAALFEASDACVTPVLSLAEAQSHPQNRARALTATRDGVAHTKVAPVIGGGAMPGGVPAHGADTAAVLAELGYGEDDTRRMSGDG